VLEAFCVVRLNDTIAPWGSLLAPAALDCSAEASARKLLPRVRPCIANAATPPRVAAVAAVTSLLL